MSLTRHSSLRGFTIVELLIVIVVIAILAAITVVAYNGIRQRSRNGTRTAAAVNIYKQLELYTRQTDANFPYSIFCVPTSANYDSGDGGLLDCNRSDIIKSEYSTVNTAFQAAGMKFNYPDSVITGDNGTTYRGIHVSYISTLSQGMNGVLRPLVLTFYLEGDQNCGNNASVRPDWAKVSTDPLNSIIPATKYAYSNGVTQCMYSLTYYQSV